MNNDLISREALREDLRRFFPVEVLEGIEPKTFFAQIMHDIDNAPTVDLSAKWAEAHSMGYDVGYTKGLEDARPKGEWIPVSERLPDKNGNYLVCLDNGEITTGIFDEEELFMGFWGYMTAWQPLPEPYKVGGEKE